MASSKDTFEGKSFASNTFAVGVFRGIGAIVPASGTVFFRDCGSAIMFKGEGGFMGFRDCGSAVMFKGECGFMGFRDNSNFLGFKES